MKTIFWQLKHQTYQIVHLKSSQGYLYAKGTIEKFVFDCNFQAHRIKGAGTKTDDEKAVLPFEGKWKKERVYKNPIKIQIKNCKTIKKNFMICDCFLFLPL